MNKKEQLEKENLQLKEERDNFKLKYAEVIDEVIWLKRDSKTNAEKLEKIKEHLDFWEKHGVFAWTSEHIVNKLQSILENKK